MRIICINGWSASAALLGGFEKYLRQNHEVIVLDHLYQYPPDEIRSQLDNLMKKDTVLMGWSLGGMLAVHYIQTSAVAFSSVRALILLQVTPCFMQKTGWSLGVRKEDFEVLQSLVEARKATRLVRHFSHLMLAGTDDISEESFRVKERYNVDSLPDWPILSTGLSVLKDLDLRDFLPSLSLPVLGIFGENDVLIKPEVRQYSSEHCPEFKGVSLPGMGHFPFGKHAETVAKCINDYLQTVTLMSLADDGY